MDIYDALRQDHETVKDLLKKLQNTAEDDASARETLLATLRDMLEIHTTFEEEVFYPAVAERQEAKDEIADAIDEHDEAMTMVEELEDMDDDSPEWTEQLTMLSDALHLHIEEEETEIFDMARETIERQRAEQMAKDYARQKQERLQRSA